MSRHAEITPTYLPSAEEEGMQLARIRETEAWLSGATRPMQRPETASWLCLNYNLARQYVYPFANEVLGFMAVNMRLELVLDRNQIEIKIVGFSHTHSTLYTLVLV